ncbi:MAG: putative bifunctional diguanylate cyclase/phosphodiesterase [Desulfovibrionales bacterium]
MGSMENPFRTHFPDVGGAMRPDRAGFLKMIRKRIKRDKPFAVLSIFVRGYRYGNVLFGYEAGERLLRSLSGILDMNGEWGLIETDCFGLIVDREEDRFTGLDKSVVEHLDRPVAFGPVMFSVGLSVGAALYPEHGKDAENLLRKSDLALTRLWRRHEMGFELYSEAFDKRFRSMADLAMGLDSALKRKEFSVYYQPQYHLDTGKMAGAEALIRWKRKERFVSPGEFIPLAEMTGRIARLGHWVLETACRSMVSWPKAEKDEWTVGVNVSVPQFHDSGFVSLVRQTLDRFEVPSERLELEITESVAMESFNGTAKKLKELGRLGIGLALDDFGTGFSALSYLHRLPFTKLKIDKSFLHNLSGNRIKQVLAEEIIRMGKKLGLTVVAEGVENEHEFIFLRDHGCDLVQGYFCSEPLTAEAMAEALDKPDEESC